MVSLIRGTIFLLLIVNFSIGYAADRFALAKESLRSQLDIIYLVTDDDRFAAHLEALPLASEPQSLIAIIEDIHMFWSSQNIAMRSLLTLQTKIESNDVLAMAMAVEPAANEYLAISNHIRYLHWLAKQDEWMPIEPNGWLKLGDSHRSIVDIRRRLDRLGDGVLHNLTSTEYDLELEKAILIFQQRHGLETDGVVGPATLRWLNTTASQRANIIADDFVARNRYLTSVEQRYLLINIPAYEMVLVDSDRVVLNSRVIVGKPYRRTPLLKSHISNMVLNPTWRVPRKLMKRDLLPKVGENGSYFSEGKFDVFNYAGERVIKTDQEWQDLAQGDFPYRIVQQAGETNTLGRFKFFFENQYNVYLHDTLDKALFEKSDRALSSGCIRVEKVQQLANWMAANLVKDKQTWVEMQQDKNTTQWFSFHQSLPVHLVYWTSWVGNQNRLQFRTDIYKRHQKLSLELASQ
ncbi:L,D-transpeptidase family protein [Shewanella waksmanii]|uniref:L,D-transpeptidase family protein n=1 Tax=Shewanella waksmanii TaxID=213783 RepID=UPI003735B6F0